LLRPRVPRPRSCFWVPPNKKTPKKPSCNAISFGARPPGCEYYKQRSWVGWGGKKLSFGRKGGKRFPVEGARVVGVQKGSRRPLGRRRSVKGNFAQRIKKKAELYPICHQGLAHALETTGRVFFPPLGAGQKKREAAGGWPRPGWAPGRL